MSTVEFRHIVKKYGALTVLENLDLTVDDGEFLVLLGPSGCGKTTLLNVLAGLLEINDGRDPHRRPRRHRPRSEGPRPRHGVPVLRALPDQDGAREPEVRPGEPRSSRREEIERRIAWAAKLLQIDHLLRSQAGAAVRRPAPARRDRPSAGQAGRPLPLRRTAVESRRQAPHRDAHGDQEAAQPAQEHRRLRHPRPGRGDDHGDQDRRHGPRRHPADRHARRDLRPAGEHLRRRLRRFAGDEHARRRGPATNGAVDGGRRAAPA